MSSYALLDIMGWIDGIVTTNCGFNPEDYPCAGYIEIDDQEAEELMQSHLITFWDGSKFCQIKDPKDIWRRLGLVGFNGQARVDALRHCIKHINEKYTAIPSWNKIAGKTSNIKRIFNPSFECELLPGLKICISDENDLDVWESEMIDSGLYKSDEAWLIAAQWLNDPLIWPIKTIWKDRILQIEVYQFDHNNPYTVHAGFTAHIDRIRPLWFWKQLAKPVFKSLYRHGFEIIRSSIRKDKPEWANFLKNSYGAENLGETDSGIILRYQIKDSLQKIGDWPERKTLGADWRWYKNGVLVREAKESDLSTLHEAMDISWGDNPRKQLALEMLEDRWILDKAAVLLGFHEDKIIDALVIRERSDPTLNLTGSPLKWFPKNQEAFDTAWEGFLEWQKAIGYKTSSFIAEAKLFEKIKNAWGTRGYKPYIEKSNIIEWRINIEEELYARKNIVNR